MCDTPLTLILLYLAIGYISGSIPFGLIIGKLAGLGDIRKTGSGNIGATNMLRAGGKKLALLTLVCDGLKGAVPVMIGMAACVSFGAWAYLGAILGHMFPVWLKFKGGKGVATAIGSTLAINPPIGVAVCATWLTMAYLFRYSSLSALVAVAVAPILLFAINNSFETDALSIVAAVAILIWVKHHENIDRLLKGEEPKIGSRK